MTSLVHTTITQKLLQRDLNIPPRPCTTRVDLANKALTMADLSHFKPQQLSLISPSPSKENDLAQQTDSLTFDCAGLPGNPSVNVMAMFTDLSNQITDLSNQINELKTKLGQERQQRIHEQQGLQAQLATLQPITRRILIDTYLSVKGYRSSHGPRLPWISTNIAQLLPPTGITTSAFEQKLL